MRIRNLAIVMALSVMVSSCTPYNRSFDPCPGGVGQKCTSVSEIDRMIDLGLIGDGYPRKDKTKQSQSQQKQKTTTAKGKKRKQRKDLEVWIPSTNDTDERYV